MNQYSKSPRVFAAKLALFGFTLALFAASAVGYVVAKSPAPDSVNEQAEAEQLYYKQLTYAANEIHYQLLRWSDSDDRSAQVKDKAYVDSLMKPLESPPEELIVAGALVDDLYQAYNEVYAALQAGAADDLPAAYRSAEAQYQQFLDNAVLIRNLHQFSGLNVICH